MRHTSFRQKGVAATEMLLVLPVLLMLLVGILEISRIFIQYTTLNKAVRAGARYALVGAESLDSLAPDSQIKNMVVYGTSSSGNESQKVLRGISTSDVSVDSSGSDHVTVTAVYAYSPAFSKVPFTDISLSMDLTASATMRRSGI